MQRGRSLLLLVLGILGVRRSVLRGLGALGGDGPLGELHTHTVGAGLDDDGILLHLADGAYHAADGGDLIAHRQLRAHLGRRLFLLVLRPDEQEIEDRDQDHERQKHTQ